MALKKDRRVISDYIDKFATVAGERGGVVVYTGAPSGVAMDQAANTVGYSATNSGVRPAGVLMQDVVVVPPRGHINFYKDEVLLNTKANVLKIGEITTNMIVSGQTPTAGTPAYLGANGNFSTVAAGDKLGHFETGLDADGFARISVNIQ